MDDTTRTEVVSMETTPYERGIDAIAKIRAVIIKEHSDGALSHEAAHSMARDYYIVGVLTEMKEIIEAKESALIELVNRSSRKTIEDLVQALMVKP